MSKLLRLINSSGSRKADSGLKMFIVYCTGLRQAITSNNRTKEKTRVAIYNCCKFVKPGPTQDVEINEESNWARIFFSLSISGKIENPSLKCRSSDFGFPHPRRMIHSTRLLPLKPMTSHGANLKHARVFFNTR